MGSQDRPTRPDPSSFYRPPRQVSYRAPPGSSVEESLRSSFLLPQPPPPPPYPGEPPFYDYKPFFSDTPYPATLKGRRTWKEIKGACLHRCAKEGEIKWGRYLGQGVNGVVYKASVGDEGPFAIKVVRDIPPKYSKISGHTILINHRIWINSSGIAARLGRNSYLARVVGPSPPSVAIQRHWTSSSTPSTAHPALSYLVQRQTRYTTPNTTCTAFPKTPKPRPRSSRRRHRARRSLR